MAFDNQKWARFSAGEYSANGIVGYTYKNDTETLADIKASGYFDAADDVLVKDDVIYVLGSDGHDLLYVVSLDPVVTGDYIDASAPSVPDGSITTAKLADEAVTSAKLADGAVSGAKIAALGVAAGKYAAGSIATADIAALAITGSLLAGGSVSSAKIVNGTLKAVDFSDEAGYVALRHSGPATAATSTAFTVTGTLATDMAVATMTAGFSQAITGVVCSADTVTVYYAAAAVVTDTVDIAVLRTNS